MHFILCHEMLSLTPSTQGKGRLLTSPQSVLFWHGPLLFFPHWWAVSFPGSRWDCPGDSWESCCGPSYNSCTFQLPLSGDVVPSHRWEMVSPPSPASPSLSCPSMWIKHTCPVCSRWPWGRTKVLQENSAQSPLLTLIFFKSSITFICRDYLQPH